MARYTKLAGFELYPVDAAGRPRGVGRSPGLHGSDIIDRMAITFGATRGTPEGEQAYVRMISGFVLERMIEPAFGEWMRLSLAAQGDEPIAIGDSFLYEHKGDAQREIIKHGWARTPDFVNPTWELTESYKMTWKSQAKFEDDWERQQHFWRWEVQEKDYLYALGYRRSLYFILWVNGDYTRRLGHGPQVVPYLVEYDDAELQENHENMCRYRDLLLSEGAVPAGPIDR